MASIFSPADPKPLAQELRTLLGPLERMDAARPDPLTKACLATLRRTVSEVIAVESQRAKKTQEAKGTVIASDSSSHPGPR